ncbi:DUF4817 domain-containing protein [Trichonephila clavipes]|uniref:DUF4817 domain-containing protein n=1 Tax=Trichonephila clavipes TaxID=2585209 RepID=A0A8X6SJ86_TRICX|nr:DUF4817 domain-containing protein [Trichonephila clavipes]
MITLLVQPLRGTESVADRKSSGRVFIMKTKLAYVETALQRSPLKRPSVCMNIITKLIPFLKVMKGTLGSSKTAKFITHHGTIWKLPSQRVQTCSIGEKDLVTWQAMVGRHILEDINGRVAQYVDEHYPVDKWHLGDLIA